MPGIRDAKLGRLGLPTTKDDLGESLGDSLDVVGDALVAGERRPRSLSIGFPVHGTPGDANPYTIGDRMRRQLRSLMQNTQAKLQGIYMTLANDSEQNGWLLVGDGELRYAPGGATLAEYELDLRDVYKAGSRRTHRRGYRLESYDRRLSTTPRDYRRTLTSTDFAAQTALSVHALPPAATDIINGQRVAVPLSGSRPTIEGSVLAVSGRAHGEVVHFEQAEASHHTGDVVLYDRRGLGQQAVWGGPASAQDFGWEEVYGPDYPLAAGDVPVLENGCSRFRFIADLSGLLGFGLDAYGAASPFLTEQARLMPQVNAGGGWIGWGTLHSASVVEWTPERAVVRVRGGCSALPFDLYITQQRGWTAPRLELYTQSGYGARFVVQPAEAAAVSLTHGTTLVRDSYAGNNYAATSWTTAGAEPWASLVSRSSLYKTLAAAVLQAGVQLEGLYYTPSSYFGASARFGFHVINPYGGNGYLSMTLGQASPGLDFEAETYVQAPPAVAADAGASGGSAVSYATGAAVRFVTRSLTGGVLPLGKYAVYARVRVSAGTGFFAGVFGTLITPYVSTTSVAYVWLRLGEIDHSVDAENFGLNAYNTTGGALAIVDRIVVSPVESRAIADYTGPRDVGQANLYDSQAVPVLIPRG